MWRRMDFIHFSLKISRVEVYKIEGRTSITKIKENHLVNIFDIDSYTDFLV